MNIPQYWAKASAEEISSTGKPIRAESWGWSDTSEAEARDRAKDRARGVARRLAAGETLGNFYEYADRPIKEERVREVECGVITRTGYGSLVLNCPNIMFIDVDAPKSAGGGLSGFIAGLFGKKRGVEPPALTRLKQFQASNSRWSFRVYATHSGFRYLVTNAPQDPMNPEIMRVMDAVGADPLYMKLCKGQKCFRARVSPKPWRCGSSSPNVRFPFAEEYRRAEFERWRERYDKSSSTYATAHFIEAVGEWVAPEIQAAIVLHDQLCKASGTEVLA